MFFPQKKNRKKSQRDFRVTPFLRQKLEFKRKAHLLFLLLLLLNTKEA